MNIQNKYWQDLVQAKFECFYIDEYICDSHSKNNTINMMTAVTSSASIAGWAIWNEFGMVWGIFIALSQVLNAIKPQLNYNKRTEYLYNFSSRLCKLFNKYDYNWLRVSDGSMCEEEINTLIYDLREEAQEIYDEVFNENHLPKKDEFQRKADERLEEYFAKYI